MLWPADLPAYTLSAGRYVDYRGEQSSCGKKFIKVGDRKPSHCGAGARGCAADVGQQNDVFQCAKPIGDVGFIVVNV